MNKQEAYSRSEVIFKNDRYEILKPSDWGPYYYFMDPKNKYPLNHKTTKLYLFIDKQENVVYAFVKEKQKDFIEKKHLGRDKQSITVKQLYEELSDLQEYLDEITDAGSEFYSLLKKLKNGEQISFQDFQDSDDLSIDVSAINTRNPMSTRIKIDLNDEIFDLLDYSWEGEWQAEVLKRLFSPYSDVDFGWSDRVYDDYREGHLDDLLKSDTEKWGSIVLFVDPTVNYNEDLDRKFFDLLYNTFRKPVDRLLDDYADLNEQCNYDSFKHDFKEYFCGIFEKYNIFSKNCFGPFYTTLGNLLYLYEQRSVQSLSLKELFKELLSDSPCNWEDYTGGGVCLSKFYDRSKELEMAEKFYEDCFDFMGEVKDIKEYNEINKFIKKNLTINRLMSLPKDKTKKILIQGVDPKTNEIRVQIWNGKFIGNSTSMNFEDFKNFLYHPEFDFED